jgi:hypothetical protein
MLAFRVDVVLCDFCRVDFSSYELEYFAREKGTRPVWAVLKDPIPNMA